MEAIRALVKEPVPAEVLVAAGVSELAFGKGTSFPNRWMPAAAAGRPRRGAGGGGSGVARIELPADYAGVNLSR